MERCPALTVNSTLQRILYILYIYIYLYYIYIKDTDLFRSAWSEGLYDLRKYEPGYCFTYDPPSESGNGINNGLYILLGHEKLIQPFTYDNIFKRDSSYITHSFEIFLHDKVSEKSN